MYVLPPTPNLYELSSQITKIVFEYNTYLCFRLGNVAKYLIPKVVLILYSLTKHLEFLA